MKLVGNHSETVQLIMHYPVSLSDCYGKAAVEILNRIRGNIERYDRNRPNAVEGDSS
jgi:hypothetical protein